MGDVSQGNVEFDGAVAVGGSDRALRVDLDGDAERVVWIPRSLIAEESEVREKGDEGRLVVPEWWAIQEGLV